MKNCAEIDRLMTPYVDDEVDTRTRRAVQAHLVDCPPCRERADAEVAEYPDSGKVGAYGKYGEVFSFLAPASAGVDYFDGEDGEP